MTAAVWFWIAALALALGGLFSALQTSLRQVSRVALDTASDKLSPQKRDLVERIGNDLDHHAVSIALPRLLMTFTAAVAWIGWVAALRQSPLQLLDIVLGLLIATLAGWVVVVAIPTSISRHAAAGTICLWARLIRFAFAATYPLRAVSAFLDEVVRRLAGDQVQGSGSTLEAELLSVVEEGEREGRFDESARDMIESVVQFRQTSVEEIMTPRTDILALPYTDDLAEVSRFVRHSGHSRIPIYQDDLDHILGILYAKDLLNWLTDEHASKKFVLRELLRAATFVPETKTVAELLNELIANRVHIAVAADEYGGTAGIVTIEDIIEEVFGDIADEYDEQASTPSVDIDPENKVAEIDARKHIDDANDALEEIDVELPESEDYDTVGGFVVVTLGHIPEAGAVIEREGFRLTVLEAEQTRVTRVRIERTTPADQPAQQNGATVEAAPPGK